MPYQVPVDAETRVPMLYSSRPPSLSTERGEETPEPEVSSDSPPLELPLASPPGAYLAIESNGKEVTQTTGYEPTGTPVAASEPKPSIWVGTHQSPYPDTYRRS